MRTKIHWARKSQKPLAMAWTISRGNISVLIRDCQCTTDLKNDILTDRVITYFKYES